MHAQLKSFSKMVDKAEVFTLCLHFALIALPWFTHVTYKHKCKCKCKKMKMFQFLMLAHVLHLQIAVRSSHSHFHSHCTCEPGFTVQFQLLSICSLTMYNKHYLTLYFHSRTFTFSNTKLSGIGTLMQKCWLVSGNHHW